VWISHEKFQRHLLFALPYFSPLPKFIVADFYIRVEDTGARGGEREKLFFSLKM
jgi:hypothetical protein